MSDSSPTTTNDEQHVVLSQEFWRHRLIVHENAPSDLEGGFTDQFLREQLGQSVGITVHGEERQGYFLSDFEIAEDGKTALLTLDFYDLAAAMNPPGSEGDQGESEQANEGDENGPNDQEIEGRHAQP